MSNMALHQLVLSTQTAESINRRTGNYSPSLWGDNFLQSLKSDYEGDVCRNGHEKLKEDARHLLKAAVGSSVQLELIDDIIRLGIGYHFELEIKEILNTISTSIHTNAFGITEDLYTTSLCFRLLRKNGFKVIEDVFQGFMDEMGCFNIRLCDDTKGLLSLYEASHIRFTGETILDRAEAFAVQHLKGKIDKGLQKLVEHSLEVPLHWRVPRLESRQYIDFYEKKEDMSHILLELAKLDFNFVQAIHQSDLKTTMRWWRNLELGDKLSFARDRIVESFLWSIGMIFEPQFRHCREVLTKVIQLITIIDDIYDIYGSVDELELFTNAIDRWDTCAMEKLPEYMKICFLALYNTVNEIGYNILKDKGVNIIPNLKRSWVDFSKAALVEAKWQQIEYQPSLEEYLKNACVSVGGVTVFTHAYFLLEQKEAFGCLEEYTNIIQISSMIIRLANDLATSTVEMERGDVPKCIQCYMSETGASELTAREHVKSLIRETWKKMNEDILQISTFPKPFISVVVDAARMGQSIYQNGDGFSAPNASTKDNIKSLLIEPHFIHKHVIH